MRVVVDASVVAKWVLPPPAGEEPDAERAVEVLRGIQGGDLEPLQPPHWLAEVAAVVARLVPEQADDVLDLLDALEFPVADGIPLYKRASSLAHRLDHHLFDTLYHAVALDGDATLITADERYWRKARELGAMARLADWRPAKREETDGELSG